MTAKKNDKQSKSMKNLGMGLTQYSSSKEISVPRSVICDVPKTRLDKTYFYVSDLHLDHQYAKKNKTITEKKIKDHCKEAAHNICDLNEEYSTLFICGDVAHDPGILNYFFDAMDKIVNCDFSERFKMMNNNYKPPAKVFYIPGNHEYWFDAEAYKYAAKGDIITLNDELYIKSYTGERKYTYDEIMDMSDEALTELIDSRWHNPILGGTGFSGRNPDFNAEKGQIYRGYITTTKEDKARSKRFCDMYKKIVRCKGDSDLIVATHNPPRDWMSCKPGDNCWYVYGHTHNNEWSLEHHLFANNQWGYDNPDLKNTPKSFTVNGYKDIFADMDDGIHEITKDEFRRFHLYQGLEGECNREGQIYCLKSKGYYMFILKKNDVLYLLKGGQINKLKIQDMQYYLEYMSLMGKTINKDISKYMAMLNEISKQVQSWGGSGKAHGCIVDIDFYNHIYLNPLDLTTTPYFARSMVDKTVYTNVRSLIHVKCPMLKEGYEGSIDRSLTIYGDNKIVRKGLKYESTDIYKMSRKIKFLQATYTNNIIRSWVDDFVQKYLPEDSPWIINSKKKKISSDYVFRKEIQMGAIQ